MIKIWAKTIYDDKITRSYVLKLFEKYDADRFFDYLVEICTEFDIPTPAVTKTHINHYNQFNIVRFKESDFVEAIDFEVLILENASE